MVRILLCVVFVSLFIESVFTQDECTTPLNQSGTCIVIHQCPSLLNLLKSYGRNKTSESADLLRKSACGFQNNDPLVCCPIENLLSSKAGQAMPNTDACQTPSQMSGRCIELNQCPSLFRLFQTGQTLSTETVQYLRQSQCTGQSDDKKIRVCCPLQSNTTDSGYGTTQRPRTTTVLTTTPSLHVIKHPNLRLLPTNNCGIQNTRALVLGGSEAHIDEFPWIALILYNSSTGEAFRCGGTLINKRYILTAAHCLTHTSTDIKILRVRLGEYDITTERDCSDGNDCNLAVQDIGISEIVPHPEYNNKTYQNDIGLIRLRNDAVFTENVKPICLPTDNLHNIDLVSRTVTVAGWGQTSNGKSTKLQKFHLEVISNENCNSVYSRYVQITNSQMCTESTGTLGSCSADGGDPLMMQLGDERNTFFQYGVVSFGPTVCGIKSRPEVFTRVIDYIHWILQNIKE